MELLEREEPLGALEHAVTQARAGRGSVVVVAAEAGAGKSALVRAGCERTTVESFWGYCDPLTTPTPLGPLHDIAREVGPALAEMLTADVPQSRAAFAAWLSEGPARLVVVEDAHWIDDATADVVRFVGRRIHHWPAVLVVTCRDEIAATHRLRRLLGELAGAAGFIRIDLAPLSPSAVAALADHASRSATEATELTGIHELTQGNAFLVTEMLFARTHPPTSVRDSVAVRLSALSAAARHVVELLAVVPGRCHVNLISDYGESLDEAAVANLAVVADGWVRFRHELVRLAVADGVAPMQRQALHAELLARMSARGDADPAALAYHADEAHDERASVQHHIAAGRAATEAWAHREARDHYEAALRGQALIAPEQLVDLVRRLSLEQYLVDGPAAAAGSAQRAVNLLSDGHDPLALGDAMRWLSRVSVVGEDSERLTAEAVTVLTPLGPTRQLAAAYAQRANERMLSRDLPTAVSWADTAIEMARQVNDQDSLVTALQARGSALLLLGDPAGASDLRAAIALADGAGLEMEQGRAHVNLVSAAGEACLYDLSEQAGSAALAFFTDRDLDVHTSYLHAWRARCQFEQGRWTDATQSIDAVFAAAPTPSANAALLAACLRGRISARRGESGVWTALDEAQRLAAPSGLLQRLAPVAAGRAEARWLAGSSDDGTDGLCAAYELARDRGIRWAIGELGFWMWRHDLLDQLPTDAAAPYRLHTSGDLIAAAAAWTDLGRPYEAADALADSDDEESWRAALEKFAGLGARPAYQRVARQLRAAGVRSIPRGPRAATREAPHGLTPREQEVAQLVQIGHSDAEIAERLHLSVKTVGHHVSAVLNKTGARTRRDLIVASRQR